MAICAAGNTVHCAPCHSRIIRRRMWLGKRPVLPSSSPVIGLVDLVASQRSMADRSYACPSAAITGSLMISVVIGQMKSAGGSSSSTEGGLSAAKEDDACSSGARLNDDYSPPGSFGARGSVEDRARPLPGAA